MSFDYETFYQYYPEKQSVAFSKKNHSRAEAALIASKELGDEDEIITEMVCSTGYVYYGYGTDEDDEPHNGWWLVTDADTEKAMAKNHIECWVFSPKEKTV